MKKHKNPPRDYTVRQMESGPLGGLYVEVVGGRSFTDGSWYIENETPEFFAYRLTGFGGDEGASVLGRDDSYAEVLAVAKAFAKKLGASLDDRYEREHLWQPGEWEHALTPAAK